MAMLVKFTGVYSLRIQKSRPLPRPQWFVLYGTNSCKSGIRGNGPFLAEAGNQSLRIQVSLPKIRRIDGHNPIPTIRLVWVNPFPLRTHRSDP